MVGQFLYLGLLWVMIMLWMRRGGGSRSGSSVRGRGRGRGSGVGSVEDVMWGLYGYVLGYFGKVLVEICGEWCGGYGDVFHEGGFF